MGVAVAISLVSEGCIRTDYGLEVTEIVIRCHAVLRYFYFLRTVQNGSGAHQIPYLMIITEYFSGDKEVVGCS